jgi:hypothetical protein
MILPRFGVNRTRAHTDTMGDSISIVGTTENRNGKKRQALGLPTLLQQRRDL